MELLPKPIKNIIFKHLKQIDIFNLANAFIISKKLKLMRNHFIEILFKDNMQYFYSRYEPTNKNLLYDSHVDYIQKKVIKYRKYKNFLESNASDCKKIKYNYIYGPIIYHRREYIENIYYVLHSLKYLPITDKFQVDINMLYKYKRFNFAQYILLSGKFYYNQIISICETYRDINTLLKIYKGEDIDINNRWCITSLANKGVKLSKTTIINFICHNPISIIFFDKYVDNNEYAQILIPFNKEPIIKFYLKKNYLSQIK